MQYINETEKFWKHSYRVHLDEFDTEGLLVNADHEQDALDYAVDHAEKMGWMGLFTPREEVEEEEEDYVLVAGNHGLVLNGAEYVRIIRLD